MAQEKNDVMTAERKVELLTKLVKVILLEEGVRFSEQSGRAFRRTARKIGAHW